MSYRGDHDAALARIEALEQENARLTDEISSLRAGAEAKPIRPTANDRVGQDITRLMLLGCAAFGVVIALAAFLEGESTRASPPSQDEGSAAESAQSVAAGRARIAVEDCARTLVTKPALDGSATDPRGCRDEVYTRLTRSHLEPEERRALQRWLDAEDALSNERSLLETYSSYGEDDAAVRQLRREYDSALEARRSAIDEWHQASRN